MPTITNREATKLATTIIGTWPSGPKQGVWFDLLIELGDLPTCEATYRLLRNANERPPSLAEFRGQYRRLVESAERYAHTPSDPAAPTRPPWLDTGMSARDWTTQQRLGDRLPL